MIMLFIQHFDELEGFYIEGWNIDITFISLQKLFMMPQKMITQ